MRVASRADVAASSANLDAWGPYSILQSTTTKCSMFRSRHGRPATRAYNVCRPLPVLCKNRPLCIRGESFSIAFAPVPAQPLREHGPEIQMKCQPACRIMMSKTDDEISSTCVHCSPMGTHRGFNGSGRTQSLRRKTEWSLTSGLFREPRSPVDLAAHSNHRPTGEVCGETNDPG